MLSKKEEKKSKRWRPAKTPSEWKLLMKMDLKDTIGLIRTLKDWDRYILESDTNHCQITDLHMDYDFRSKEHPLSGLDKEDIERFASNLVFRNGGIAGARFSMLDDKMSYRKFLGLWARFGIDLNLLAEWDERYCVNGKCFSEADSICTTNC